jgi:hypothetical protein
MPLILSLNGQDLTRVIRQGPEEPGCVGVFLMLKLARNEIPAGLRICRLPDRLSTPPAARSALFAAFRKKPLKRGVLRERSVCLMEELGVRELPSWPDRMKGAPVRD